MHHRTVRKGICVKETIGLQIAAGSRDNQKMRCDYNHAASIAVSIRNQPPTYLWHRAVAQEPQALTPKIGSHNQSKRLGFLLISI